MPPKTLARIPYLIRWLCFVVGLGLVAALILPLLGRVVGEDTALGLFFGLLLAGVIVKILALDLPRIRSIGWSPWLLFLCPVPVLGGVMQILLLVMPPKPA